MKLWSIQDLVSFPSTRAHLLESTFLKTRPTRTLKFQITYLFAYKIKVSAFPPSFIQPSCQVCTAALKATRNIQPPGTSWNKTSL